MLLTGQTETEYILGSESTDPLPVELTSFTASTSENKVTLNWQTATEVNNYGFEIERQNPDGVIPASPLGEDLSADKAGRNLNNW